MTLLDRFRCDGSDRYSSDQLFTRPALTWQLERKFDRANLIALFAATADMQRGTVGFSRGAKRYYAKRVD